MRHRDGMSIAELLVSTALLAGLLTVIAQMLTQATVRSGAVRQRLVAQEEAASLMEEFSHLPYELLRADAPPVVSRLEARRRALPDWRLTLEVQTQDAPLPHKELVVQVGPPRRTPVRLVSWVYAPPSASSAAEVTEE